MASSRLFEGIPPFPDNIPTAEIATISLSDLRNGDASASGNLLASAQHLGFFLLDLSGDETGNKVVDEIDRLFDSTRVVMNLSDEVKHEYRNDPPRNFLGFKPQGSSKTETMEPDRFEWFNLGQDGLMGTIDLQPVPDSIRANLPLYKSFLEHGQDIIRLVCQTLALQLDLPIDSFTALQRPTELSGTAIRMIKAYACPSEEDLRTSMVHHSDIGTITLLANVLGGLQILAPKRSPRDEGAWLWVRPQPGCLIVNLGDAMTEWSGGLLRSNVHRIRYPPGDQRFHDRYSLAILARAERNASMKSLIRTNEQQVDDDNRTNLVTWEWEVKKFTAFANGDDTVESKGGKI
ncbi:oxidoreductase [Astrocystis sublimbata]|nr:oxidoreductase [Astrocystis sublimbata]